MTAKDGHGSIAAPEGMAVHSPADRALPRLEGVEHRFVDLPRLRMHVAQAGSGDPVLLLHGFPQHWWQWRKVIPALAQHHRVICPDLRGAGWTDAPPAGYTRKQLLADVVALLDTLEVDRVHLIAHDAGVPLGFELCLNHPGRVRNYLALSVPHPYIRFSRRMLAVLWHDLWLEPVLATPLLGPGLMSKPDQRFVPGRYRRMGDARLAAVTCNQPCPLQPTILTKSNRQRRRKNPRLPIAQSSNGDLDLRDLPTPDLASDGGPQPVELLFLDGTGAASGGSFFWYCSSGTLRGPG